MHGRTVTVASIPHSGRKSRLTCFSSARAMRGPSRQDLRAMRLGQPTGDDRHVVRRALQPQPAYGRLLVSSGERPKPRATRRATPCGRRGPGSGTNVTASAQHRINPPDDGERRPRLVRGERRGDADRERGVLGADRRQRDAEPAHGRGERGLRDHRRAEHHLAEEPPADRRRVGDVRDRAAVAERDPGISSAAIAIAPTSEISIAGLMRTPTKRKKHEYAANATARTPSAGRPETPTCRCCASRRAARRRRARAPARQSRAGPARVRKTSAATAVFVTGETPIRNEMCATDVCCAATENSTVMNGPKITPATITASQRRAPSRGGSSRHATASAIRHSGSAHAARATATVIPSNVVGSAANSALLAGPSSPHPKTDEQDEDDVLRGARHALET